MNPLAIAGFLSALAIAHATAAVYSLAVYAHGVRSPGAADTKAATFGLLNVAVVALDAGVAQAYGLAGSPFMGPALGPALAMAEAGRVAALTFLVHYVLQYMRTRRSAPLLIGLYATGAFFASTSLADGIAPDIELRRRLINILGVLIPDVSARATVSTRAFAVISVAATVLLLALLGRTLVRGHRAAARFVALTLLAITVISDALRSLDWTGAPPLEPLGYAIFVNAVILTLLVRFVSLQGQLEDRAQELKVRAKNLADSHAQLRQAQDELVRKEQLAAVGELSAVVAHEVRNPLAIISNAVATLRRSGIGDEDRGTLLQILDEESSRLNRLVGDLLRYARPVNLERQNVSLRDLAERGLSLAAGRSDVVAELIEPVPIERIWADANLIRQVLDNLIANAIQAMGSGGVLRITLLNLELDGVQGVEVQIQDTGEGMNTQVRRRALDPFFTTRPAGTGLGLAIVARIIDAHGGVLRIRSQAGVGTVMHVFLPVSSEQIPVRASRGATDRRSSEPPLPAELRRALGRTPR